MPLGNGGMSHPSVTPFHQVLLEQRSAGTATLLISEDLDEITWARNMKTLKTRYNRDCDVSG